VDLADFGGTGFFAGYFDDRDAGFTSPDLDITTAQTTYGLDGEVAVTDRLALTFGADRFEDAALKERSDARLGVIYDINARFALEVEAAQTDRSTPGSTLAEDNGTRTDLGAKLTFARDEDLSLWIFGQATLKKAGGLGKNNRLGFGAEAQLSDALSVLGEVSDGSLGSAGRLELAWAPNAKTTYTMGYRLDPLRFGDSSTVTGKDKGTLVFGTQSRLNDQWSYTAENSYSAFGSEPAIATTYGVSYPEQALGDKVIAPDVLHIQRGHFRSPPPTTGEGEHQHGAVADAAMGVIASGKQGLEDVSRDGLG
jgi:hypothetical protein